MQGLLQICATRQLQHLFDAPRHLHFSELPSVFMLEDSFRQTQADKATGDDPLPSELFHRAASPLANMYHDDPLGPA
jgi:hypothetical protein